VESKVKLSRRAEEPPIGGKGGTVRAKAVPPEARGESARKAVRVRWAKAKKLQHTLAEALRLVKPGQSEGVSATKPAFDIIVVGGGLGGATLAKAMSEAGLRVLVLERETQFKDRVRGETVHPWGVAEARELGILDLLLSTCGHEVPWVDEFIGGERIQHRELVATTPHREQELTFYHPAMQNILLQAAADAGANVWRGAHVRDVRGGTQPEVTVEHGGCDKRLQTRIVVGADGRGSMTRRWGGFAVQRDPQRVLMAGMLFDEMPAPMDTFGYYVAQFGRVAGVLPHGNGRVRIYFTYQHDDYRLQGDADVSRFVAETIRAGAPAEFYAGARPAGPLATFDCADTWVGHPCREGVVLIGDAAGCSDPSEGTGMSLTLRDVRVLRDSLLHTADWDSAGHVYAAQHDRYYGVIHTVNVWKKEIFYDLGPAGEMRRAQALPLIRQDPTRMPDHVFGGPDLPLNETMRRRFFGEE
jgi:menaquinone-9 beta-reductase